MIALLLCRLAFAPLSHVDRCDCIEINTVMRWEDQGDGYRQNWVALVSLEQCIFWEHRKIDNQLQHVVRDWKYRRDVTLYRDGDDWCAEWRCHEGRQIVRSRLLVETWTFYDRERNNRWKLPYEERRPFGESR